MSILLDSLRKSEAQRKIKDAPTIHSAEAYGSARPGPRRWLAPGMVVLTAAAVTWFGWQQFAVPGGEGGDLPAVAIEGHPPGDPEPARAAQSVAPEQPAAPAPAEQPGLRQDPQEEPVHRGEHADRDGPFRRAKDGSARRSGRGTDDRDHAHPSGHGLRDARRAAADLRTVCLADPAAGRARQAFAGGLLVRLSRLPIHDQQHPDRFDPLQLRRRFEAADDLCRGGVQGLGSGPDRLHRDRLPPFPRGGGEHQSGVEGAECPRLPAEDHRLHDALLLGSDSDDDLAHHVDQPADLVFRLSRALKILDLTVPISQLTASAISW